ASGYPHCEVICVITVPESDRIGQVRLVSWSSRHSRPRSPRPAGDVPRVRARPPGGPPACRGRVVRHRVTVGPRPPSPPIARQRRCVRVSGTVPPPVRRVAIPRRRAIALVEATTVSDSVPPIREQAVPTGPPQPSGSLPDPGGASGDPAVPAAAATAHANPAH